MLGTSHGEVVSIGEMHRVEGSHEPVRIRHSQCLMVGLLDRIHRSVGRKKSEAASCVPLIYSKYIKGTQLCPCAPRLSQSHSLADHLSNLS